MKEMSDTERVEALTALSQQMMTHYHGRRTLEWRMYAVIFGMTIAMGIAVTVVGFRTHTDDRQALGASLRCGGIGRHFATFVY